MKEKRNSEYFFRRILAGVLIATILLLSGCNGKVADDDGAVNPTVTVDDGAALP